MFMQVPQSKGKWVLVHLDMFSGTYRYQLCTHFARQGSAPNQAALRSLVGGEPMSDPVIRFRMDFAAPFSVGPGKIALLEGIQRAGSLSQAARDLGMSYRRAWQLLASLNRSFRKPVVVTVKGGRGGGGARLTGFGRELLGRYRAFEEDTQARASRAFKSIADKARRGTRGARFSARHARLSRPTDRRSH
jgi:molybdate transport system regulatory protein